LNVKKENDKIWRKIETSFGLCAKNLGSVFLLLSAGLARAAGCARAFGKPLGFQHDGRHSGNQQEECNDLLEADGFTQNHRTAQDTHDWNGKGSNGGDTRRKKLYNRRRRSLRARQNRFSAVS
jgi:hypothetical protein